jgi:hypothetical protein
LELAAKLGHDVKIAIGPVRRRAGKIELHFACLDRARQPAARRRDVRPPPSAVVHRMRSLAPCTSSATSCRAGRFAVRMISGNANHSYYDVYSK